MKTCTEITNSQAHLQRMQDVSLYKTRPGMLQMCGEAEEYLQIFVILVHIIQFKDMRVFY